MATPTVSDMRTTLDDAHFYYQQLDPIIRGPEHGHDLALIRRYFRGYLHCWKTVAHYVRKVVGAESKNAWTKWCERWATRLSPGDYEAFECLRQVRDYDTHEGTITLKGEIAAGLFPLVMLQPADTTALPRELITCCAQGLSAADKLIREHPNV